MKKLMILFVLVCSFQIMHSQEIYLKTGRNYTNYDFKSDGVKLDLQAGSGSFYEIGYLIPMNNSDVLSYSVGLSLNEYNALGGKGANYLWNTEYAGVENSLSYSFVQTHDGFDVGVQGGLGVSTIVYGKQQMNGSYLDVTSQKEFSGLLLTPKLGLQAVYTIDRDVFLSLGYNISKSFNVTNTTPEILSFNTHQIQLGIYIHLN